MHTNNFKIALYSSAVVIKDLNSSRKLFQAKIVTYPVQPTGNPSATYN